jgi:hypothetical protein
MREYFLNLLQHIDKLAGLKQYEKLCQMPDFKSQINTLLDILCRVCDQFPFIPEEDKKAIINDAVIADQEFIGLNAKIIYKWLSVKKEFYTKPSGEPEISPEALTGEAREKRLQEWLTAINGMEMVQTKVDPFGNIKAIQPEDGITYTPKPVNLYEKQRHLDYVQDNYDAKTGKELPTWISEESYNKIYDKEYDHWTEEANNLNQD